MRYGYFDNEHREYVVERPDVPVSWTNYLGVKDLCAVISPYRYRQSKFSDEFVFQRFQL